MSERAKRMGEFLEKKYSWSIFDNPTTIKCECGEKVKTNFCPDCGRDHRDKLNADVLQQMEEAIQVALGERGE
jgi:hypothetical protein